jgi:hypothetical protein
MQTTALKFEKYRNDPAGFARDILKSEWWEAQQQVASLLAQHRRVAVKAANGVGKTFLAADLTLWFLYCHSPGIVLTTAPTWRQVENLLWSEIRRRFQQVNTLPGTLLQTKLKLDENHFAMGLSTDEPVRFQGFHSPNLLVMLDEACGVPDEIWDAIEGICVGRNNRVLALSNPLQPYGRFYTLFQTPGWKTCTISALMHPNVTGDGQERIPGAITRDVLEDRIAAWCEEAGTTTEADGTRVESNRFAWQGKLYQPDGIFRVRVLGEFPDSGEDSLFARSWIEEAMARSVMPVDPERSSAPVVLAVDVARFGSDETALAVRRGDRITRLLTYRHLDTMQVAEQVRRVAEAERAERVVIDGVGIGAGVVDRLQECALAGVISVHFSARPAPQGPGEAFLNLRAQTYWMLRERLKDGRIVLPNDTLLREQLQGLRYEFSAVGQIQIEGKDDLRRRGLASPDRADAVAMAFGPYTESGLIGAHTVPRPGTPDWQGGRALAPVAWHEARW